MHGGQRHAPPRPPLEQARRAVAGQHRQRQADEDAEPRRRAQSAVRRDVRVQQRVIPAVQPERTVHGDDQRQRVRDPRDRQRRPERGRRQRHRHDAREQLPLGISTLGPSAVDQAAEVGLEIIGPFRAVELDRGQRRDRRPSPCSRCRRRSPGTPGPPRAPRPRPSIRSGRRGRPRASQSAPPSGNQIHRQKQSVVQRRQHLEREGQAGREPVAQPPGGHRAMQRPQRERHPHRHRRARGAGNVRSGTDRTRRSSRRSGAASIRPVSARTSRNIVTPEKTNPDSSSRL